MENREQQNRRGFQTAEMDNTNVSSPLRQPFS